MSRTDSRSGRWSAVALSAALAYGAPGAAGSSSPAVPADAALSALAVSLAERLGRTEVALPDGTQVALIDRAGDGRGLLTPGQLQVCLRSISQAESWPAAWLVVQHAQNEFDLVMRIALDDAGAIRVPEFLFTVPRREWEIADIKPVVRRATGRKPPRRGVGHLVVQGFSTRVVESYVYEPAPTGEEARGLARLLPEGSLIREAKAVDLADGRRYTLALVLRDPVFEPSECADCPARLFGHADSGGVTLLLADEAVIVDEIDLGPRLHGLDGRPLLPRYRCEAQDRGQQPALAAFDDREEVSLIQLADLDGDGLALELALPARPIDCERHVALIARIIPRTPALEIVGTREISGDR